MRQLKRTVKIGNITIGGTNPIAVQTMLNVPVKDIAGNVEQAKRVAKAGCQIVRVTVPTPADAAVVSAIKEAVDIPVVATLTIAPPLPPSMPVPIRFASTPATSVMMTV